MKQCISAARARELFEYLPETGVFTRKIRVSAEPAGSNPGYVNSNGYLVITVDGIPCLAHRLAYLIVTGSMPKRQIDHVDGNRSNNRWTNLREASNGQNGRNRPIQRNNKSGVKGVSWHGASGKWRAQIRVDGEIKYLGLFVSLDDAEQAVRAAREAHHGQFANHG